MAEDLDKTNEPANPVRRDVLAGAVAAAFGGAAMVASGGEARASENHEGDRCLTVLFPTGDGVTFDIDYYIGHHIPLVLSFYGKSIRQYEIFKAETGPTGAPPPFFGMANIWIADEEAFMQAGRDHAKDFGPDVPNFYSAKTVSMTSVVYKVIES